MTITLAKDKPLWSDERIDKVAINALGSYGTFTFFDTKKLMRDVRDQYEAERTQLQARIAELEAQAIADGWNIADTDRRYHESMEENEQLEQQLAQAGQWEPLVEDERTEVCESHFVEEAGDDASRYFNVWVSSTAIMFDNNSMIELPDGYSICQWQAQQRSAGEEAGTP